MRSWGRAWERSGKARIVGLVIAGVAVAALAFGLNTLWGAVVAQQARAALQARIAAAPVAGKIAFVEQIEEKVQICVLDADGPDARCFADLPVSALDPAWSPDGRRIAFTGLENEDQDIYVMDADGTHARNLTHRPGRDESPTWSPDGKQIAFAVDYYGRRGIAVMDAAGGNIVMLLDEPYAAHPAWSPDGKQIAFVAFHDQQYHIFTMDANGGNVRPIARGAGQPAWTPDSRLTYLTGAAGNEVYVVNADGAGAQRFFDQTVTGGVVWAPGGQRIAFVRDDLLYVADSTGANIRRLPNDHPNPWATPWAPTWAPDGRHLAFTMFPDKNTEIFAAAAGSGGNLRRLTSTPAADSRPALAPDGRQIAFISNRDGGRYSYDLYVMNSDGSNLRRPIQQTGSAHRELLFDSAPVWSPDGRYIAFVADYRLKVVDAAGGTPRDLGRSVASGRAPSWAPDSQHLVFDSLRELFVAGVDDRTPDSVLTAAWAPAWAPDGRQIAFISQRDGEPSLYLMDADGSHVRRLSATPAIEQPPVWAQDSTRLAFLSGTNSADRLCIIEAGGQYERFLPKGAYSRESPAWAPKGLRLAFAAQGDADRWQIHIVDAGGEDLHRLVDTPADSTSPVWGP
jgi:Tol biopolymer transport system component